MRLSRLRTFFIESKDIARDSYIWNTMSATIFALQSAIILMAISRTGGLQDAGIFSIAYAVGSLMYYIGEYGVRRYQVSDVNEELTFTDYHSHRIVSCVITLIASLGYAAYGLYIQGYSIQKAYTVLIICLIKVVEAYAEVYFARFQQVGRLDVSAKTNFYRTALGVIACIFSLIITKNMELSITVWLTACILGFFTSSYLVYKEFGELQLRFHTRNICKIFMDCAPLFAGYFFLLYVSNAPKYAIDACMSDIDQACYNFIFMPVFAIGMFANFIFNPILVKLAHKWDEDKLSDFSRITLRQIGIIGAITVLAIAVALTIGAPILGLMFNADLLGYKMDLAILMLGGGMLALVNFFAVVITVMREQKHLTSGYIIMAVIAGLLANRTVETHGIRGATVLYTVLMALLSSIFAAELFFFISKRKRNLMKATA